MVILELAGQFLSTGLWALALVGAIQFAIILFDIKNNWVLLARWVVLAALVVFPHGWDLVFADPHQTSEALTSPSEHGASSSELFQADFLGATLGALIGYGAQLIKSSDRH